MAFQTVFKRHELKYLLTEVQKNAVLCAMRPYMALDEYGRTSIRNIYFDTDNFRLIRRSMEHPVYKEKLWVRSYGVVNADDTVFVELKKKYKKTVYKRRIAMPEQKAMEWLAGRDGGQISEEITYFIKYYKDLRPTVFLSYEREAYCSKDIPDFRVTFDDTILCRRDRLSLEDGICGIALLPEGMTLMEIKCSGGIPMWLARTLSEERIYKTSFSKYGKAYSEVIYPELAKEVAVNA